MSIDSLRIMRNIALFLMIYFSMTFVTVLFVLQYAIDECMDDPTCEIPNGIEIIIISYFILSTPSIIIAIVLTLFFEATDEKDEPNTCQYCKQEIKN